MKDLTLRAVRMGTFKFMVLATIGMACFLTVLYVGHTPCSPSHVMQSRGSQHVNKQSPESPPVSHLTPLIFIGGMPRSGTTLMRVMLDSHPDVRCGEETRVIPRMLAMRMRWLNSKIESKRLREAGVIGQPLDNALAAFILEIIAKHGEPAPHLCNKDPFTMKYADFLSSLFPNAKHIFMVRDGRAVVHSLVSRGVTVTGFNLADFGACLKKWNQAMETMLRQCKAVGSDKCLPVFYEQLVLHPAAQLRRVLDFLGIKWHPSVLHHERYINVKGGVSLSRTEKSTDQVIKPVNLDGLSKWEGKVPADVLKNADKLAPLLAKLGYDPARGAEYGQADQSVINNTEAIKQNRNYWRQKENMVLVMSASDSAHSEKAAEVNNLVPEDKTSAKVDEHFTWR